MPSRPAVIGVLFLIAGLAALALPADVRASGSFSDRAVAAPSWIRSAASVPAAPDDTVLARDRGIWSLWTLGRAVLYSRGDPSRWMRLVGGRRLRARLPADTSVTSIGRDPAGRVIAIGFQLRDPGSASRQRWWSYDIAADIRRPLPKLGRQGCKIATVSMWRSRIAYLERCRADDYIVLRSGGRETRVAKLLFEEGGALTLHGKSLAVTGWPSETGEQLRRILDRGRRCPSVVDLVPDGSWSRRAVAIGQGRLRWALGYETDDVHESYLAVMSVDLDGRCDAAPTQRLLALDASLAAVRAYALDGRSLVYATDTEIRRVRLRGRGSTSPPSNDDFKAAMPLSGELGQFVLGRTGHAGLEPEEPDLPRGFRRSVWYRFRAARTEVVRVIGRAHDVFVGSRLSELTKVAPISPSSSSLPVAVVAGETYWIRALSFGPYPTYEPFLVGLVAADWMGELPEPGS